MSEWYYDEKVKKFNDMQPGTSTMEEFVTKFVNLQHCNICHPDILNNYRVD